jgi:transcriptional regulator with XRE-family HTH domain
MEETYRQWAENLRDAREAAGITQYELAQLCGVRPASVCRWEALEPDKYAAPTDRHKVAVAAALHRDVADLFPLLRPAA